MVKLLLSEEERAIVNILSSEKDAKTLPESLPVDFIINNRICYLLYEKIGEKLESKFDPNELERIRKKAESMRFSVDEGYKVSKIFKDDNIDFAFLFKAIRSQCDSTDIDVIVKKDQTKKAKGILEKVGYFLTVWGEEEVYVNSKNGKTVQIDLTPKDFDIIKILSNKNEIKSIYVPSPNDELIILVLKSITGRRPIRLSDIVHISDLLKNCDIKYIQGNTEKSWFVPFLHYIYTVNTLHEALYHKSIESPLVKIAGELHKNSRILRFLSKIETKKIKLPFRSKILTNFCFAHKVLYDIKHFRFRESIRDISAYFLPITSRRKLVTSALSRKRMVVCFTGMDGTGKTSHATKIVETFKNMGIPCQYVWCNWLPRVSYPLMALVYLMTGGYRRKDYYRSKILRRIWNYLVIFDFIYIYLLKVKIPLLIGKNVICDRYVYDMIADLMYDGLYNERASRILLKLIPKPDLIFMLDVPENVSDLRKDDTKDSVNIKESDNAIDYLRIHRDSYLKITKSLNIPVIDATKDFEELHEEIYKHVLRTYIAKQK